MVRPDSAAAAGAGAGAAGEVVATGAGAAAGAAGAGAGWAAGDAGIAAGAVSPAGCSDLAQAAASSTMSKTASDQERVGPHERFMLNLLRECPVLAHGCGIWQPGAERCIPALGRRRL
ncbi:MAG: hypothetical protein FJX77_11660 [Armatimonadetes bacterium]|nr:hypothetical protein [Armatimonadota bacterium]